MDTRQPTAEGVFDRTFSLTLALRSIARDAGCEIDVDDLHAALGLPLFTCAVPPLNELGCWLMYGRDAFLVPAARLFGLTIRELHPPEAALGLSGAAEFEQHFVASYRPLVARALENEQPVLAWQGWPLDRHLMWGLITDTCDEGVGVVGAMNMTLDGPDPATAVPLFTPPVQLYVVEEIAPHQPDPEALVEMALRHARRVLRGEPASRWGMAVGAAAFRYWYERIKSCSFCSLPNPVFVRGHQALATSIMAAHLSAIRFLERQGPRAGSKFDGIIEPLTVLCRLLADTLRESTDFHLFRKLVEKPEGRKKLTGQFKNAERFAMDMLAILARLPDGE
jgi:hypothetical protein